ncbi:MAG TPA: ABC transporter permease [Streptosporangiaceae bacterium]|jgi:peptide/nickel transport system permease protein
MDGDDRELPAGSGAADGVLAATPAVPAGSGQAAAGAGPAAAAGSARRVRREQTGQLLRSPTFIVGALILLWWVACAVGGRSFSAYNPVNGSLAQFNAPPSAAHWFGADSLGRDVLSRVLAGARDILIIAPLATLLGTTVGTVLGLITGYYRGAVDSVIGRIVDAGLALPVVITAFLFIVALGPTTLTLIVVIGFVFALLIARTVRTAVLQERDLDYVAAARLRDESGARIMFAEILPNVFGPILVEFTVRLGYAIFTIATLSFLGFGIRPPTPDWGGDIAGSYQYLAAGYWWETLFPALAIASLVVAVNLIADSVEAVLIQ